MAHMETLSPSKLLPAVEQFFREKGLKLTGSRRKVIEQLIAAGEHLSADELADRLRQNRLAVSKATLYRTLHLLRQSGLFDAHDFGTGQRLYEPISGRPHHDHLYCIGCGAIVEFSNPEIERQQEKVVRRYRFQALYHSHKIFGYCNACQQSNRRSPSHDA